MTEPTPRQVLYALVAGGFLIVAGVLTAGAAIAGLVPVWWTVAMSSLLAVAAVWSGLNWRKTSLVLVLAMGLFLAWTVGTLLLA